VHYTVFTYWRTRLANSSRPEHIREVVDGVVKATGVAAVNLRRLVNLGLGYNGAWVVVQ